MRNIIILLLFFCLQFSTVGSKADRVSLDIEKLFKEFFQEYVQIRPETGTILGLSGDYGIDLHNDKLDDVSEQGFDALFSLFKKYSHKLSEYDRSTLSPGQKISYDKLKWYLDTQIESEKYRFHGYIIDPMLSFHNSLTTLMTEHHKIITSEDALDYVSRLNFYKNKISQYLEQLEIRKPRGIIPPVFIIQRFKESLKEFISIPIDENILYTSFKYRIIKSENIDPDQWKGLLEKVRLAITHTVYPSYKKVIEYAENLQSRADMKAGVWKLPDGEEYYKFCLRHHTTTDMRPEEIHTLGLKQVKQIQKTVRKHLKSMGYNTNQEYNSLMRQVWRTIYTKKRNEYVYSDTESGKYQILHDFREIVKFSRKKIPELFNVIPKTPVQVKSVPEFMEKTMGTFYQPLKLDKSSSGIFFVNLSGGRIKPGMECLSFHEAIPGHHFQIALDRESPEFRLFYTLLHPTGYIEGWALYVEKLALENEWYSDTYSVFGYYNSELFRAVRLVVDTGIHYKKWSREQARTYMNENLGWSSYNEIDRYITWPGQACAYKIGEIKILELRKKAKNELENMFNIKDFHDVVLKYGSLPLIMLEKLVEDYINKTKEK